jgi:NADH:ubiquinone oxidoreductase subunit 2 (subunit N)
MAPPALLSLTGLLLTTGTNHLLFLFVALELASLSLYLLAGFVGKFAMFSAAMAESTKTGTPGLTWLVGLAAVMSAISLYYYLSVLKQTFVRDAPDGEAVGNSTVSLPHL